MPFFWGWSEETGAAFGVYFRDSLVHVLSRFVDVFTDARADNGAYVHSAYGTHTVDNSFNYSPDSTSPTGMRCADNAPISRGQ
ncbi:hypothetical protein AA106555_0505 [Neokomagataea thailandica NBRC 106555]|uniref:Uncharacterized protein n=1 Tax=Neokomagataea thailandica NBRC 106555 TaxID=1223520 RepID=A0ABQ0QNC8_9PROT|nr:hypothetical protein AA106555_0505 [Neokomagataea thailandica NBRC 106555]